MVTWATMRYQVESAEYYGVKHAGPVTSLLAAKMFGIHAGTEPDHHGWVCVVMKGAEGAEGGRRG